MKHSREKEVCEEEHLDFNSFPQLGRYCAHASRWLQGGFFSYWRDFCKPLSDEKHICKSNLNTWHSLLH